MQIAKLLYIGKDTDDGKSCKSCTLVGLPSLIVFIKRHELPISNWKDVAMDLLGSLSNSDYVLVVKDCSRYKEMFSRLGYSITMDDRR